MVILLTLPLALCPLSRSDQDTQKLIEGIKHYDSLIKTYEGEVHMKKLKSNPPPGMVTTVEECIFIARDSKRTFLRIIDLVDERGIRDKFSEGVIIICLRPEKEDTTMVIRISPERVTRKGESTCPTRYFRDYACILPIDCDPASFGFIPWGYKLRYQHSIWEDLKRGKLKLIGEEKIEVWDGKGDPISWPGQKKRETEPSKRKSKQMDCYVVGRGEKSDSHYTRIWIAPEIGFRVLKSEETRGNIGIARFLHYRICDIDGEKLGVPDRVLTESVHLNHGRFVSYIAKHIIDAKIKINTDVSGYFDLRNWIPVGAMIMDLKSKRFISAKELFKSSWQ